MHPWRFQYCTVARLFPNATKSKSRNHLQRLAATLGETTETETGPRQSTPRSARHLGSCVMFKAWKKSVTPRQMPSTSEPPKDEETRSAYEVTPSQAAVVDVEGQATEGIASSPVTTNRGLGSLGAGGLIEVPDEPRPVVSGLCALGLFFGFVLLALVLHHGMPAHIYAPYLFALCSSPMIYITWRAEREIRDKSGMKKTWLAIAILFALLYFTLASRFGWWPSDNGE